MADYEDGIFSNLPRGRRRPGERDDDDRRLSSRQLLAMNFVPEGPLPQRPRPSGKGGPSVGQGVTPTTSVWSASDAAANGMTLTNGGLTATNPAAATYVTVRGTISRTAGKYYVEFFTSTGTLTGGSNDVMFGLADASFVPASGNYLGHVTYSAGWDNESAGTFVSAGFTVNYGLTSLLQVPANDVYAIAVDLAAGQIWLAHNNVWAGTGNPATGANPAGTIVAPALGLAFFPGFTAQGVNGGSWTLQPTAASQKYAPPAGFTPWG